MTESIARPPLRQEHAYQRSFLPTKARLLLGWVDERPPLGPLCKLSPCTWALSKQSTSVIILTDFYTESSKRGDDSIEQRNRRRMESRQIEQCCQAVLFISVCGQNPQAVAKTWRVLPNFSCVYVDDNRAVLCLGWRVAGQTDGVQ